MPLILPFSPAKTSPGSLLYSYWGAHGFYRPKIDVFALGPSGPVKWVPAQIDCASDYVVLEASLAPLIGLGLPCPRQVRISSAAGTQTATISFPPDGLVSLFVTDYREYAYLPAPLVGFHALTQGPARQRSVLGQTGFLQFFRYVQDPDPTPPIFELHPRSTFPGQHGILPRGQSLLGFIRSLRGGP